MSIYQDLHLVLVYSLSNIIKPYIYIYIWHVWSYYFAYKKIHCKIMSFIIYFIWLKNHQFNLEKLFTRIWCCFEMVVSLLRCKHEDVWHCIKDYVQIWINEWTGNVQCINYKTKRNLCVGNTSFERLNHLYIVQKINIWLHCIKMYGVPLKMVIKTSNSYCFYWTGHHVNCQIYSKAIWSHYG